MRVTTRKGVGGNATRFVSPTAQLFFRFDPLFTDWDPAQDAQRIAGDLIAGSRPGSNQLSASGLASLYGWKPRRLNPALLFLETHKLGQASSKLGIMPLQRFLGQRRHGDLRKVSSMYEYILSSQRVRSD